MPKKQFGLFSCVNVKEEVMHISVPINATAKKELDRLMLNSGFSEEERKIVKEINEKILIIEKLKLKTKEQEYLLKLMLNIKTFYTQDNYLSTINPLKQMIAIYVEESKRIDWQQFESKPLVPPPVLTSELQQDSKKQEIQVKQIPTRLGIKMTDELLKKLAEQRRLVDKQVTINTDNVSCDKEKNVTKESVNTNKTGQERVFPLAEQSLKVKSINQEDIQKQSSQTVKQTVNSDKSAPSKQGLNVTDELANIFAKRKEISERNDEVVKGKDKVISYTTNVSPDEQSKLFERAAVGVQLEQKKTDNIAAPDQTQNSDEDSFLLHQLKVARNQIIKKQTTVQEDNLSFWVKSEFIDLDVKKRLLEKEEKEQACFNFLERIYDEPNLSGEERQSIINFWDQVCNVELRPGNEADKKRFENTVSKIVEENSSPNSNDLDEVLKTLQDFINEQDNKDKSKIVEMTLKPRC